jgi:hypothetical protein
MFKYAVSLSMLAVAAGSAHGAVVAGWNFNTLSISTAGLPGTGTIPTTIAASTGSGSLSLAAWNGNVDDFGGTTVNAISGDAAEESLSLIAVGPTGGPFAGNGRAVTWSVNLSSFENPFVSFATQRSGTGFNSNQFAYSVDGGSTWVNVGAPFLPASSFTTVTYDLSAENALDFAASAIFRITFSGATANSANNRIDNLVVDATFIPTPGAAALLGLGGLVVARRRRA